MFGRNKTPVKVDRMVVINSIVRANNTASGNPVMYLGTDTDLGLVFKTKPDAQIAHDLTDWHVTSELPIPAVITLEVSGKESLVVGVRAVHSIKQFVDGTTISPAGH